MGKHPMVCRLLKGFSTTTQICIYLGSVLSNILPEGQGLQQQDWPERTYLEVRHVISLGASQQILRLGSADGHRDEIYPGKSGAESKRVGQAGQNRERRVPEASYGTSFSRAQIMSGGC